MVKANSWLLTGARVALDARSARDLDIEVRSGRIHTLASPGTLGASLPRIDLRDHMILPGLINAHDHLEMNLFPRLGRGPYVNAAEWARDIHHPDRKPVREHLRVPLEVRLRWGGIKNLLSGVTTVSHHNPYDAKTFEHSFPVRVVKRMGWAHSLQFSPNLSALHRETPPEWPFIVHVAESTDAEGANEVLRLKEMGALDARTVLVHGVALGRSELRLARRAGASLVWCPSSNLFILGRTLDPVALRSGIPLALGTDSALTGAGDLLDELRIAARASGLDSSRLYAMVTTEASRILRLTDGEGSVQKGSVADILVIRDSGLSPARALLRLRTAGTELVLAGGEVKLSSLRLSQQLPAIVHRELQPAIIEGRRSIFLRADIRNLYQRTAKILGARFSLAGKTVEPGD